MNSKAFVRNWPSNILFSLLLTRAKLGSFIVLQYTRPSLRVSSWPSTCSVRASLGAWVHAIACRRPASSIITRSIDAPLSTCSTSPKPQPGSMPRPLACLRLRPPVRVHPLRLLRAVQRYRPPHQHPHARHHYQACPPACPSRPARLFSCPTRLTGLLVLPLSRSPRSPSHAGQRVLYRCVPTIQSHHPRRFLTSRDR